MTGWPEPPAVGSETDTLLGSLERQRAVFAYKCADLTDEYGRHPGHADLIREAVDGRVGEDPPGRPYPYALG